MRQDPCGMRGKVGGIVHGFDHFTVSIWYMEQAIMEKRGGEEKK
jgi:hypothetical protein